MDSSLDNGDTSFVDNGETSFETTELSDQVDINQICRLCANAAELTIPIFEEEGLEHDLKTKIAQYLPIKVKETDKLPTKLCYQCASTIVAWHDLFDGCFEAEKKLKDLIGDDSPCSYEEETYGTVENSLTDFIKIKPKGDTLPSRSKKRDRDQEDNKRDVKKLILNNSRGKEPMVKAYENIETTVVVQDFVETEDGQLIVYIDNDAAQALNSIDGNVTLRTSSGERKDVNESINDAIDSVLMKNKVIDEHIREAIETVIKRVCHPGRAYGLPLGCEMCPRVFTNKASLRFHMVAHKRQNNLCTICNANYKRLDHLHKHIQTMHPDSAEAKELEGKPISYNPYAKHFECEVCFKVLRSQVALDNHATKHQGETPFHCNLCPEKFRKKGELRRHEVKDHNLIQKENGSLDGYNICEECGMEFFSDGGYYHHKTKHGEPVPCYVCGKMYSSRSLMMFHAKRHTNMRPYKCKLCGKGFKMMPEVRAHMRAHADIRPYQCPHCPHRSRKSSDLAHHVRTHTGEKPFVCDICSRGFAQAGDMRKHRLLHFKERSKICRSDMDNVVEEEVEEETVVEEGGAREGEMLLEEVETAVQEMELAMT